MRGAAFTAVEREELAHDLDALGPTGLQIRSDINRVPKMPEINAPGRAGTIVHEVDLVPRHDVSSSFSFYGANGPIFI
jgi:hypothetical protein